MYSCHVQVLQTLAEWCNGGLNVKLNIQTPQAHTCFVCETHHLRIFWSFVKQYVFSTDSLLTKLYLNLKGHSVSVAEGQSCY